MSVEKNPISDFVNFWIILMCSFCVAMIFSSVCCCCCCCYEWIMFRRNAKRPDLDLDGIHCSNQSKCSFRSRQFSFCRCHSNPYHWDCRPHIGTYHIRIPLSENDHKSHIFLACFTIHNLFAFPFSPTRTHTLIRNIKSGLFSFLLFSHSEDFCVGSAFVRPEWNDINDSCTKDTSGSLNILESIYIFV